jgi:hypothetical protein
MTTRGSGRGMNMLSMTRSGARAVFRFGRQQGWTRDQVLDEIQRIGRIVDQLIARDQQLDERDRWWLEVAVRDPESAPMLQAFHSRRVPPGMTIQ